MKNKKNAEEIAKMRKQDYVTNKLLLVFTIAFAFLLFIMSLDNMKSDQLGYLKLVESTGTYFLISVGVFAVGVVWTLIEKFVAKRNTEYKLLTGMHLAIIAFFAMVCLYDLDRNVGNNSAAFTRLYVFVPLVVLLYIVFSSYQLEFFFVSLAAALGGVALWNMKDYVFGDPTLVLIAAACLIVVAFAVTVLSQKNVLKLFPEDTKYIRMYISYALMLVLLATAFLFAGISMYLFYVAVAYFVIAGVYYTIKLI